MVVGWLAETTRPHGFAISETQFQLFILNASRRLFSDRFFTSSFRPEFYTRFGIDWVNNNGPLGKQMEPGAERPRAGGRAVQAHSAAQHPGARTRVEARRQQLRSLGAGSRRILLAAMEAESRCQDGFRVQRLNQRTSGDTAGGSTIGTSTEHSGRCELMAVMCLSAAAIASQPPSVTASRTSARILHPEYVLNFPFFGCSIFLKCIEFSALVQKNSDAVRKTSGDGGGIVATLGHGLLKKPPRLPIFFSLLFGTSSETFR